MSFGSAEARCSDDSEIVLQSCGGKAESMIDTTLDLFSGLMFRYRDAIQKARRKRRDIAECVRLLSIVRGSRRIPVSLARLSFISCEEA